MTNQAIQCERCKASYDMGTLNAAAVTQHALCLPCCLAKQVAYDAPLLGTIAQQQRPPETNPKKLERVFVVRVTCDSKKPIKDLADHVANRIWSLDGVSGVTATEAT